MGSELIVRVHVPSPAVAELVADRLWSAGAVAVGEAPGRLDAGFGDDSAARVAHDGLLRAGHAVELVRDDGSWRDAWRADAVPVRVGPLHVRLPAHDPPTDPAALDVVVEPGRAFGSGSHPTTRLALGALVELVRQGSRVLDVGTGSGVLAVAAAALGATEVVAVDVDAEAVETARANVARNGFGDVVELSTTAVDGVAGTFDVVVANLGGSAVVRSLGPALAARTARPDGVLVLSGLLTGVNRVDEAWLPGLTVASERHEGDWSGVLLRIR